VNAKPRGNSGNVLPVVLAFASVGFIVVAAYLAHQARANTSALRAPAALQATLNARSGVYRALERLTSDSGFDTLKTISAVDQLFRTDMFDDVDTGFYYEPPNANGAKRILLYTGDSVNASDVAISNHGIYSLITSRSTAQNITRAVEARLGCPAPAGADTVLILENALPVNGRLNGKTRQIVKSMDTLSSAQSQKTLEGRISSFISGINRQIIPDDDTSSFGIPVIIRAHSDLAAISDTVRTHLTLDGASTNVVWKDKRKIAVYGDLQITGSFRLENLEFSVSGEIRILDNASLANVYIFSMQRIFIGDNAAFHGDALAMGSINVYGNAEVIGKSSLIAVGSRNFMPQGGGVFASNRYSILISESSVFDGTAVALGGLGGIKTDHGTKITGILWAQKAVCHNGALFGIIKAEYLFDCSDPNKRPPAALSELTENAFGGTVAPLSSIGSYNMPYFMGAPRIVDWREF
jgi:hypothetical protein